MFEIVKFLFSKIFSKIKNSNNSNKKLLISEICRQHYYWIPIIRSPQNSSTWLNDKNKSLVLRCQT